MASDSPRSRAYREFSPDPMLNTYPRAYNMVNPAPDGPKPFSIPDHITADDLPPDNYPKPAFLSTTSIQHYPAALTDRYLPPLPAPVDYYGRPVPKAFEEPAPPHPPPQQPSPPQQPPMQPPPSSVGDMADAILAGGPAGPSQFAAASGVPRLPPILQVERQQVTSSATQMASASRRRNEALFACPVPNCGSTFTRRFNLRGVYRCCTLSEICIQTVVLGHLRSHTEERPFVCGWPGCTKGFARSHDCKYVFPFVYKQDSMRYCVAYAPIFVPVHLRVH